MNSHPFRHLDGQSQVEILASIAAENSQFQYRADLTQGSAKLESQTKISSTLTIEMSISNAALEKNFCSLQRTSKPCLRRIVLNAFSNLKCVLHGLSIRRINRYDSLRSVFTLWIANSDEDFVLISSCSKTLLSSYSIAPQTTPF